MEKEDGKRKEDREGKEKKNEVGRLGRKRVREKRMGKKGWMIGEGAGKGERRVP